MSSAVGKYLVILGAVALAYSCYSLRRHFIATFFDRSAEDLRPLGLPSSGADDLPPTAKVRVLLLDGLGAAQAATLPHLNAACATGLDLEVDVGFPTVSLPVQTVLWTGLTQQQAGVQFVGKRLDPPPTSALPGQRPDSIAVAEQHPYLVHSFGFVVAEPPGDKLDKDAKAQWMAEFEHHAIAAVRSMRSLAFVHIGRIDVAGHRHGSASGEYRRAAEQADALAGRLFEAAGDSETRWFVLSDHGHLPGGGHGGVDEAIRIARGCIFGAGVVAGRGRVHLVDVSRSLFASLAVTRAPASAGRPVAAVAAGQVGLGSTLPTGPGGARLAVAVALALAGVALTLLAARRNAALWPWWLVLAGVSLVLLRGAPTLSNPMVYPPQGRAVYVAALPGLLALAAVVARARGSLARVLIAQLGLPVSLAMAALVACGGFRALTGGPPPLLPVVTASASVLLVLSFAGSAAAALAALVRAALSAFGRGSAGESRRTDA